MSFYQFIYLCLVILVNLYFELTGTAWPVQFRTANFWINVGFLALGGYFAARVILDCIVSGSRGQMLPINVRQGILMAGLYYLPTIVMSIFLIKEAYKS